MTVNRQSQRTTVGLLLLLVVSLLSACAGTGSGTVTRADLNVVAEDEQYAIVRLGPGQSPEDLARVFLGSPAELWQIAEVNATSRPAAGDLVAVPLRPTNATSVYAGYYRSIPILCYHQFTRDEAAHRLELRARDFEAQLRYLRDEGYQFLAFEDVAAMVRQQRPIPEKAVVLTIDDGYGSVYDVAWPLLQKYNARATLFIYTDFIGAGAAMTWEQLRELDASPLIEVESHGKSHASLARLPEDSDAEAYKLRLVNEISGSEAAFMARLGRAPRFLSYPYGNSSRVIADLLRDSGYDLAATVTRGPNGSFVDPFLLHRTMIYADHSLSDLKKFVRTSWRY